MSFHGMFSLSSNRMGEQSDLRSEDDLPSHVQARLRVRACILFPCQPIA